MITHSIRIHKFKGIKNVPDTVGTAHTTTWGALCEELSTHQAIDDKNSAKAWAPFALRPGTTVSKANIEAVDSLWYDCDQLTLQDFGGMFDRLKASGVAAMIHTTHSHLIDGHTIKCRVGILTAEPVLPEDFARVREAVRAHFEIDADANAADIARRFYTPTRPPNGPPAFAKRIDGEALDVSTITPKSNTPPKPKSTLDPKDFQSVNFEDWEATRCPDGRTAEAHGEHLAHSCPAIPNGEKFAMSLARALVWGLEIPRARAEAIWLEQYASRCTLDNGGVWTEAERIHKFDDAEKEAGAPYARGFLLASVTKPPPASTDYAKLAECERTDRGNSERFAIHYGGVARYCVPLKTWFIWDGTRWARDVRHRSREMAKAAVAAIWRESEVLTDSAEKVKVSKWAHQSGAKQKIDATLDLATSALAVLPADFDRDAYALNVQNGTLDLRTGNLRPHSIDDYCTKLAPVDFDPNATSEVWDSFLATITCGDDALSEYDRKVIGLSLIGEAREKAFFFGFGAPDSGKSTFIDAIAAMLGDYAVATDADSWLDKPQVGGNRGDLVRLLGARFVTAVEFKCGAKFDEKLIKGVTGGDAITAAAKYEGEITFAPTFTLFFAANDAPAIRGEDAGMWNRVRRIPFDAEIPASEQDKDLRRKLRTPECQKAILAWAVKGCLDYQSEGLGTCDAVTKSSESYRSDTDGIGEFIAEHCVRGPDEKCFRKALYAEYKIRSHGRAVKDGAFSRRLTKTFGVADGGRFKQDYRWLGISLKSSAEAEASAAE